MKIKDILKDANEKGYWVLPGLIDMHVHLRDPGLTHKENIFTGLRAAAAGGFTTVVTMANTSPVCDNERIIKYQIKKAKRAKLGRLLPICAVTKDMDGKELVTTKNFAYSDDGKQINNADIIESAMKQGMFIFTHYDDPEHSLIQRDIELAIKHNARLHIQHVSTATSVEVIRNARKTHPHLITAEATPHHFTLTEDYIKTHNTSAKMSPPLRTAKDRNAVFKALQDGTISCIATDHAPHTLEEKSVAYRDAPNGIIGLETAVGLALTYLKLSKEQLTTLMHTNPAKILGLKNNSPLNRRGGAKRRGSFTIIDPNLEWTVDSTNFHSKSNCQPYDGMRLKGKVLYTICKGRIIYGKIVS